MRAPLTIVLATLLLAGCGAAPTPTAANLRTAAPAVRAAEDAPEAATKAVLEQVVAGHNKVQSRRIYPETDKDIAFLNKYNGRTLTIQGVLAAKKSSTLLGLVQYVSLAAETDVAGKVPFLSQEFGPGKKAQTFLDSIPQGKPVTVTFKVARLPYVLVNANSPFLYQSAK